MTKKQTRQLAVVKRLEAQLVSGVKPIESALTRRNKERITTELTEQDRKRINNELLTLKTRV